MTPVIALRAQWTWYRHTLPVLRSVSCRLFFTLQLFTSSARSASKLPARGNRDVFPRRAHRRIYYSESSVPD